MPSGKSTPLTFPELPSRSGQAAWPADITDGHLTMKATHKAASQALNLDESNPIRLQHYNKQIKTVMLSTLQALAACKSPPVPERYIEDAANSIRQLAWSTATALKSSLKRDNASVVEVPAVRTLHTSRPGRPRKVLSEPILREMFRPGRNIKVSQAARALGVHRHTVKHYLQSYQIRKQEYSQISDEELDILVQKFKQKRPTTGITYLRGHLLQQGWRIQRDRLLASISRVDGIQQVLRKNLAVKRRTYVSSRPNAMWHMDGHHKLGPWGFIIHASIDGCDSIVTGMKVAENNLPQTVLGSFIGSTKLWGWPWRVRGDRGGENIMVATAMILKRGASRGSFMWGTSTSNTRIEWLWVEVGRHFARLWRGLFTRLERDHKLNRKDPEHIWILHFLFMTEIQKDCDEFMKDWNSHPLSGRGCNRSPLDMRLLERLECGVYKGDSEEIDPSTLAQYCAGVNGDVQSITDRIVKGQEVHVRHPPVEAARCKFPFQSTLELDAFQQALEQTTSKDLRPAYLGLDLPYEPSETFYTGRSRKGITVPLPYDIWYPRILLWCRALDLVIRIKLYS